METINTNTIRKPNPRFTEFLQQPWVQNIAKIERWTISDKDKMPIDMYELKYKNHIKGCDMTVPYSTESLFNLYKDVPNASNFAFYLNGALHGIVILDIEPICPPEIKANLIKMPCLYAETSMSGKGIHMIFPYPDDLMIKYPNAGKHAMKYKKFYEILISHCVTFTGNKIPYTPITDESSTEAFRTVFETIAKNQKESFVLDITIDLDKIKPIDCNVTDDILMYLNNYANTDKLLSAYVQKHMNLGDQIDWSVFEYGYIAQLNDNLKSILKVSYIDDEIKKQNNISYEQRIWFLIKVAKEHLPGREKHNTMRNGAPWLIYLASKVISDDEKKQNAADSE